MLVGKCKKCHKRYLGWALSKTEYQTCPNCGTKLTIHNETMEPTLDSKTPLPPLEKCEKEWQNLLEKSMAIFL